MHRFIKKTASKIIPLALLTLVLTPLLTLSVSAQDFTQGYSTTQTLLRGSVVGLTPGQEAQVERINSDRNTDLLGVVVRSNDSAVTLTEDTTGVFVATTGRYEVLISDIDGALEGGDLITTSAISGIAKKAGDTEKLILGKILEGIDFQDQSKILSQTSVTDEKGETRVVKIARVLAEIDVKPNPFLKSEASAPEFLVNFSETIAGKPVSALRIYAGLIIIVIAGAISGSLLYSSVKTSIISIGRNPLSKNSVLTGLAQVVVISVIIFISGLVAVYLLLKI
jgi:hypothetical protein